MKAYLLILLSFMIVSPVVFADDDSMLKKAAKLKMLDNAGDRDDSLLKKSVKLKAAKNISNSNDSGLKKAVKYKAVRGDYKD